MQLKIRGIGMKFKEVIRKFPTEKSAIDYYIKFHYKDKVRCNHCGSEKVYFRVDNNKLFNCYECHNTFSPFAGTIFENSSTDLRKWIYALHLYSYNKKGAVARVMQETHVTYKTAWRMIRQIKKVFENLKNSEFFDILYDLDINSGWILLRNKS